MYPKILKGRDTALLRFLKKRRYATQCVRKTLLISYSYSRK